MHCAELNKNTDKAKIYLIINGNVLVNIVLCNFKMDYFSPVVELALQDAILKLTCKSFIQVLFQLANSLKGNCL